MTEAAATPKLDLITRDLETLLDNPDYSAPPRPNTLLERSARYLLNLAPVTELTWDDVIRFRENSLRVFEGLGLDGEAADRVRVGARWILADRPSPAEVLSVEAKFHHKDPKQLPLAIVYKDSPATSFPKPITELLVQSGVDHLIGHFALGVKGLDAHDETQACLLQYMAAVERYRQGSTRFGALALMLIPGMRLHKDVPLKTFRLNQHRLLA